MESLVLLEFASGTPQVTIQWILDKIKAPKAQGGAELLAALVKDKNHEARIVHIGGNIEKMLLTAELIELKKKYNDGTLREFSDADKNQFVNSDNLETFLTMAEKQRIIRHDLEAIRAAASDDSLPGVNHIKFYYGEAIIARCCKDNIILALFPLHDRAELNSLSDSWYKSMFNQQPIDRIQQYFGETIAMYFAFLGFYTFYLLPPALVGVVSVFLTSPFLVPLLCIFNTVWTTLFLEFWKRSCAKLAYEFGTIRSERFEEARPQYYGELGTNPVTGRLEPRYSKTKRLLKFYCVSLPFIIFSLCLATLAMFFYFWLIVRMAAIKVEAPILSTLLNLVPGVVYAVIILIMNAVYTKVAVALNDWENHRLQSAYENHLIFKLVLFTSVNCFMSLFYIAFVLQDMDLLRSFLATLLITQQVVQQGLEAMLPYFLYKYRKVIIVRRQQLEDDTENSRLGVSEDTLHQAEIERTKEEYAGTLDDYLEMFLQFGYVYLFSAVFPTAAFWALVNNVYEIRTDAFKMCRIFRRPFAQPTATIGVWQVAFELMSIVAVITNCALIALSPSVKVYMSSYQPVVTVLVFVLIEHVILFVKATISYVIPDEPESVETKLAAVEYQSKQAWRLQRTQEAKNFKHLNKSDKKKD